MIKYDPIDERFTCPNCGENREQAIYTKCINGQLYTLVCLTCQITYQVNTDNNDKTII